MKRQDFLKSLAIAPALVKSLNFDKKERVTTETFGKHTVHRRRVGLPPSEILDIYAKTGMIIF